MDLLEIAADCHRLRENRAVIQFQRRYLAKWIDGAERIAELLAFSGVDLNRRYLDTLFS